MQLKKQLWKATRKQQPCMGCGKPHETKECVQRNGKRRELPVYHMITLPVFST